MPQPMVLSGRDLSILRLLSWTPATTAMLLRASVSFDGGPFANEHRVRERVRTLIQLGFVRAWPVGSSGGGVTNIYKLTLPGFENVYGRKTEKPSKSFFAEIAPSFFAHTMQLADVIVDTVRACHAGRVTIIYLFRENELTITAGEAQVQPDFFIRMRHGGKPFNVAFEVDQSQESVDSPARNSIRQKIETYDACQGSLLTAWFASGRAWETPRFRVAFLTRSVERAYHILALANQIAARPERRLIYAATQDTYLGSPDPIRSPIFLDHLGVSQALVNLHPSARARNTPVRLPSPVDAAARLW